MSRICFATTMYPPQRGGVGRSAARVAGFLAAAGLEVHVVVPDRPDSPGDAALPPGGPVVHRVPYDGDPGRAAALIERAVRTVDRETPFDLFHGFFLPTAFPLLPVAARGGRPVLASIRGNDAVEWLESPAMRFAVVQVLHRATWVTSVCTDLLERAAGAVPLHGRSSVILNSIDTRGAPRWRLDGANRGVVGSVGEFRGKKDLPTLLEAYAGLPRALRTRLCLAGSVDAASGPALAGRIAALGVRDEVEVTGWLDAAGVARRLCGMHVYVQSSLHDGLPNTLLEAAASGVPLVGTAVGGMRDVLVNGESGLLVPPRDPGRLRDAIRRVLKDDALAAALSAGARRMAERLNPRDEAAAWLALYDRLLGRGDAPPPRPAAPAVAGRVA